MLRSFMLAGAFASCAIAASARPLAIEDWLNWERAANAQISPDGSSIIYTRRSVNAVKDKWDSALWMMDVNGGKHRFLADGADIRWSPDGDRIAFLKADNGSAQLRVRWMDAEGATSVIAEDLKGSSRIAWAPSGDMIAFRARVPAKPDWTIDLPDRPEDAKWTDDATVIDTLHYRMDRVGLKEWYNHIFIVPADGGTPRQITSGKWDVGARAVGAIDAGGRLQWTPDGQHILFDGVIPEEGAEPEPFTSHIYAVNTQDREIRQITREPGYWSQPALSPNGERIAYVGNVDTDVNYPAPQLRVIDFDGSDERILLDALPASAGDLVWDRRGRGIYYTIDEAGSTNVHYVTLDGKTRRVTEGAHRINLDSISENGRATGIFSDPQTTRNVVQFDLDDGELRQLTDLNGDILADVDLGQVEEFQTTSTEDTAVQGWIVTPPDFDPEKSYPMILAIHGGPHAMYGVDFQFLFQAYAARGYVVTYSNPRGSTGYGPEFGNAIDNQYPGNRDFSDLMAATDATIEKGYVDEDRLFVMGCSGGGVLTSWTVINTDRFAAAASLCPVINWISFAGTADIVAWANRRFRPHYTEDPELWLKHSPIMHVQKVKTPTLLMTGNKDLRTPLSQAEEFYSALKYLGVETKLVVMKDEYHGTTRQPSNMLRTILYLDKWFSEHDPARQNGVQ